MEQRVELSQKPVITVRSERRRRSTRFLMADESQFWLTIDCEQEWLSAGAERPTKSKRMVKRPKAMIVTF
jgi:hypothetical protein